MCEDCIVLHLVLLLLGTNLLESDSFRSLDIFCISHGCSCHSPMAERAVNQRSMNICVYLVLRYVLCSVLILFLFFYSLSLENFKEFIGAMEAVKDKGVVVAVASPDDVEAANKELSNFFQINKAL